MSALLHVTHDWFQHLEKNYEVGAVFFDFRKDYKLHTELLGGQC